MSERVKSWVNRQLSLGEFSSRGQVARRSAAMALRITVLAYGMNVSAHLFLSAAGLLPYDLFDALVIATVLTPFVALTVAFTAYYVVGLAVYELSVSHAEFERLSKTDSLSGLLNRRAFLKACETAVSPVALVILDVDRFKSINDSLGHAAGDDVIVAIAAQLEGRSGGGHIVSRIGGEEFAVLVCGLSPEETMGFVEALRQAVGDRPIAAGEASVSVTISAGIADWLPGRSFDEIFSHADRALYLAKVAGRDRVVHEREIANVGRVVRFNNDPTAEAIRSAMGIHA